MNPCDLILWSKQKEGQSSTYTAKDETSKKQWEGTKQCVWCEHTCLEIWRPKKLISDVASCEMNPLGNREDDLFTTDFYVNFVPCNMFPA